MDASKSYEHEIDSAEQRMRDACSALALLAGHLLSDSSGQDPSAKLASSMALLSEELIMQIKVLRELVP